MLDMASHLLFSQTTFERYKCIICFHNHCGIVCGFKCVNNVTLNIQLPFVRMQTSSLYSVRRTFSLVGSSFESASSWIIVLFQRVLFVPGIVFLNTTTNVSANKALMCSIFERRDALERTSEFCTFQTFTHNQ